MAEWRSHKGEKTHGDAERCVVCGAFSDPDGSYPEECPGRSEDWQARAEAAEAEMEKLRAQQRAAIAALERIPDAIGGEVYEHVEDTLEALGVPTTEEAER